MEAHSAVNFNALFLTFALGQSSVAMGMAETDEERERAKGMVGIMEKDTSDLAEAAGVLVRELRDITANAQRNLGMPVGTVSGVELLAVERHRQKHAKGYDDVHDAGHAPGEILSAAIAYAIFARWQVREHVGWTRAQVDEIILENWWPWDEREWKPVEDKPIHNLVKAGALVAAEIDRLQARP